MGISALVSHKTKNKHQEKEKDLNSSGIVFFFKNTTVTVNQQGDQKAVKEPVRDHSPQTNSLTSSVKLPKVMAEDAEIRWALKVVLTHFSYRSCLCTNKRFKTMFPDSTTAKEFSMSKTKCALWYSTNI